MIKSYIITNESLFEQCDDSLPFAHKFDDESYSIVHQLYNNKIISHLAFALGKYQRYEGNFYFGGNAPLTDNTLRRAFNLYAEKAGVKQIRIHDLRHSFVSMLIHLGANLTVVADLIGDTLAQVTKTYAHLYEEDKHKIIEKIV